MAFEEMSFEQRVEFRSALMQRLIKSGVPWYSLIDSAKELENDRLLIVRRKPNNEAPEIISRPRHCE